MAHESRQPQYFATEPSTASRLRTVSLDLPDLSLELRTDSGVFSGERIDPGTRILLVETTPADTDREPSIGADAPRGDLVDLGAGYGPIALTLALRHPQRTVWAVEPNERARRLCTANAVAAGVGDRVRVVAPEEVPTDLAVAGLHSNPPIRIGKQELHRLLERWMGTLTEERRPGWSCIVTSEPTRLHGGWRMRAMRCDVWPHDAAIGCSRCDPTLGTPEALALPRRWSLHR
ncbi:MAG: class I SAM-dependent methyltransferase [Microthrixaceae bacterium]|nr:class I SAM-dependent methyltransferase [Microthrixaceae bacterium]